MQFRCFLYMGQFILSSSEHKEQSTGRMWVVFKVYFPSVQRQNTHFKSDFVLVLSVTVFPQHGQLFSKDLLKAEFPLNAVIV